MRPKKGERITAAWAGGIQSRAEMPLSPGMQKTSGGFVVPHQVRQRPPEIAKGLDEELPPFSLVCLKPAVTPIDGAISYDATKSEVTRWIVSTGEQTVPANGKFTPVWPTFDQPMLLRVDSGDTNWRRGSTVGRKKNDTVCASAGFGFTCLTTPKDDHIWAMWSPGPTWAINIASMAGTSTPTTGLVTTGKLAWVRLTSSGLNNVEISDMREDYCRRDNGTSLADGTLIQVDLVGMKLIAVWANCAATAAFAGLTP
jgi:hypothetical protein